MSKMFSFRMSDRARSKMREIMGSGPFKVTASSIIEHGIDLAHSQFMSTKNNAGEDSLVSHGEEKK